MLYLLYNKDFFLCQCFNIKKKNKKKNSLPYCAWSFCTKKFFLGFCLGQLKVDQRDSQTLFGTQTRRKICSGGKQPSGGAVVVEDVRKEDGKLKAVEKFLVDDRKIPSWMFWVQDSFPGRLWGLFSLLKNLWALFLEFFGLRWALHSRNIFVARWFLGSIKHRLWHFPVILKVRPCQT